MTRFANRIRVDLVQASIELVGEQRHAQLRVAVDLQEVEIVFRCVQLFRTYVELGQIGTTFLLLFKT